MGMGEENKLSRAPCAILIICNYYFSLYALVMRVSFRFLISFLHSSLLFPTDKKFLEIV